MAKKPICEKPISKKTIANKKVLEIDYKLKDGRSESFTFKGHLEDVYVINLISERVAKLKLGDKLVLYIKGIA